MCRTTVPRRRALPTVRKVLQTGPTRPRTSLGRILDDLGATMLDLVHGAPEPAAAVDSVIIHDPLDEPAYPPRSIVLGVGLQEPNDVIALLKELGAVDAVALVVRAPVGADPRLLDAVTSSGVALLALARGASWVQLAALLRALLAEGEVAASASETLGGIPSGDLFALANAIAALIDAPVTIEDRQSRVLAFSGRQEEADESRLRTILGRQVPRRYIQFLEASGVFHALHNSDDPIYVQPFAEGDLKLEVPRVAIPVRAGRELLGSIWAASPARMSAEREQGLRDAAKVVALHLLRVRAGADVERRLRTELVGTALEGGPGAVEAVDRLGLARQPLIVLAMGLTEASQSVDQAGLVAERQWLSDALAMHLAAIHARAATAPVGDTCYAILPVFDGRADAIGRARTVARRFLERTGNRVSARIGIGNVATGIDDLSRSRSDADRALRVLRSRPDGREVASIGEVRSEALLLDLHDLASARGEQLTGAVARLHAYDRKHGTSLLSTLDAWLAAFGDNIAGAASVHVHPNTFRYRLRRVAEVGGIDLQCDNDRFAAMLALRMMRLSTDQGGAPAPTSAPDP